MPFSAVRDPRLSLWQSVVEERHGVGSAEADAATKLAVGHDKCGILPLFDTSSLLGLESLALRLALAEYAGDAATVASLEDALRFCPDSLLWKECAAVYLLHFGQPLVYRAGLDPVETIPDICTVLFMADWACGTDRAMQVLREGLSHNPDIIIDLGDTYYSGTAFEQRTRFLEPLAPFIKRGGIVRRVPGNHDYYSSGQGFFWLLGELGQPASYFSLVNQHWRFQGMDTGFNDADPFKVDADTTRLRDDESAWHSAKIIGDMQPGSNGPRKLVLLSHHQPFSAFESIGKGYVNESLTKQFGAVQSDFWLWGHEHRFSVYAPQMGVKRGRCIGAGAIPNLVSPDWNAPVNNVPLLAGVPKLKDDGTIYGNVYAVLKIGGEQGLVSYYEVPGGPEPIFSETI